MNTQGTIELNREQLPAEEQPMSPEKEAEYRSKIETLLQNFSTARPGTETMRFHSSVITAEQLCATVMTATIS